MCIRDSSKDQNANISNFLRARARVVNFSIDKGSIEMQAMRITLEKEEPEIQKQRDDLIKLNGEYRALLKDLETKLLRCV